MEQKNHTLKISVTAILIVIALVTNYSLIWLPQVKLMDSIMFLIAYYFGWRYGTIAVLVTRFIYGIINPYGFEIFSLFMVISGELAFVALAQIFRKIIPPNRLLYEKASITLLAFFVVLATFIFDIYTNAMVGALWYRSIMLGIVVGIPFALMHEIANLIIAPIIVPLCIYLFTRMGL